MNDRADRMRERIEAANAKKVEAVQKAMFWRPVLARAVLTLLETKSVITRDEIRAQLERWAGDPDFTIEVNGALIGGRGAQEAASDAIAHLPQGGLGGD